MLPAEVSEALLPLVRLAEALSDWIKAYDERIEKLGREKCACSNYSAKDCSRKGRLFRNITPDCRRCWRAAGTRSRRSGTLRSLNPSRSLRT
jgi:hypothetical protein